MFNAEKIKNQASNLYIQGLLEDAFICLFQLDTYDFIQYFSNQKRIGNAKNWLKEGESSQFFWTNFILRDEHFHDLLKSKNADQLFHIYFEYNVISYPNFIHKVAEYYPELLVMHIKRNRAFLREDHSEDILKVLLPENLKLHQTIWQTFHKTEKQIWIEIKQALQAIKELSLKEILSQSIIYLESERFKLEDDIKTHNLANSYNFFIELIFNDSDITKQSLPTAEKLGIEILKQTTSIIKGHQRYEEYLVSNLLQVIQNWVSYHEGTIELYCYATNHEPKKQGNVIYLSSSPQRQYQWQIDGARYELNQLNYVIKGTSIVETLEKSNKLQIRGKNEIDQQINRSNHAIQYAIKWILLDMGIQKFKIDGIEYESDEIILPLITQSIHRKVRYEQEVLKQRKTFNSWSEAYFKVCLDSAIKDLENFPFILNSFSFQKELYQSTFFNTEISVNAVNQMMGKSFDKPRKFDRFNYQYNVWETPFVIKENHVFVPATFFAASGWFYPFVQKAINYHRDKATKKKETDAMEKHLSDEFVKKGWDTQLIDSSNSDNLDGDVDVFVEDESCTLYIQLKRTKLRFGAKETYNELINIDNHAAEQLNKAAKYLSERNEVYNPKHSPVKWIVTTSFETINTEIDGCRKINYFELLQALENPEIKTLHELIEYLKTDHALNKINELYHKNDDPYLTLTIESITKRLQIFQYKDYHRTIIIGDYDDAIYMILYNKALEMKEKENIDKAISYLEKAIAMEPNDAEMYGALANFYADERKYVKSYQTFEKALQLAPDDPYLMRNYAMALKEAGCIFESLKVAAKLYLMYPLLADNYVIFNKNFEIAILQELLNQDQIREIDLIIHDIKSQQYSPLKTSK